MDLGKGLGGGFWLGNNTHGDGLGFLTSTCMFGCMGWNSRVKSLLVQSHPYLTLLFRVSSMPALFHGILTEPGLSAEAGLSAWSRGRGEQGWESGEIQGRTTGMVPRKT